MTHIFSKTSRRPKGLRAHLNLFRTREDGSMTIFACFMIVIMIMVGGIGVDLMHNEMQRTRLQGVSDRAVLAAADLDQQLAPEAVVNDYFVKSGMGDYVSSVQVTNPDSANRTVSVEAFKAQNTQFMGYLGVDTLPVPASATAAEVARNVEISLVLDISGSMRFSNRMNSLRPAAQDFIDIVMEDDGAERTSVTLVPYAGQTNPGPFMFERMNAMRRPPQALDESMGGIPEHLSHGELDEDAEGGQGSDPDIRYVFPNVSSCLELEPADFTHDRLPVGGTEQTAHFMNWAIASDVMDWGWCPQDQTAIQYFSNDAEGLKNMIGTMRMHDGTGTHYAMKYAVAMLDPSSRADVSALAGAGLASPDFVGRPASYSDDGTVKYIILMTDGQITQQVRPIDAMDDDNPTIELNEGRGSDRTQLTAASTNVASFFAQCDLAKGQTPRPVIVYTIAFEAPGTPEAQMRECASSPSHFFRADSGNIDDVFEAIGRQIRQLRLTN
ncbi:MAG: pilus assembly protein TadG-related protein [Pseudomonadota bacterium]